MIVASWCFRKRGVGTCPHEDVLFFDRRPACFAGLQGQALYILNVERDDITESLTIFLKHINSEQLKKNVMT